MDEYKKKYKKLKAGIKKAYLFAQTNSTKAVLEHILPELKESKGEEIRKNIISYLHNEKKVKRYISDIEFDKWIAWLEKQDKETSEEAIQYLKENHSPSEVSDFQAAMNIAVAKAYDKGMKDGLENTSSPVVYTRMEMILSFLDTLEVKEVDEVKIGETQIYLEDDGGEQPYDGKQWLDLSCTEYEIPKALFKDGDNVEILIRKAMKGE